MFHLREKKTVLLVFNISFWNFHCVFVISFQVMVAQFTVSYQQTNFSSGIQIQVIFKFILLAVVSVNEIITMHSDYAGTWYCSLKLAGLLSISKLYHNYHHDSFYFAKFAVSAIA